MSYLEVAYFRNAAYLNESARHSVPERQMLSTSEFMVLYRNRRISPLASFQIFNAQAEGDKESFLADELASYLVEIGDQPTCQFVG